MTQTLERNAFVDELGTLYGVDAARDLDFTIETSFEDACAKMPLITRPQYPQLSVDSMTHGIQGWAESTEGSFELIFGLKAPIRELIEDVPYVNGHEVAHIAHAQHNPNMFDDNAGNPLIKSTIREGVAEYASGLFFHDTSRPHKWNYTNTMMRRVRSSLVDIFYDEDYVNATTELDFLFGIEPSGRTIFSDRGYHVGHYTISRYVGQADCDLRTLMATSYDMLYDFTEANL